MTRGVTRTWIVGALRRPGRAILVVVTLAAMAVGTVAALVAGDALDDLFVADARAEWGDVDVVVRSGRGPFLPEGLARHLGDELTGQHRAALPRLFLPGVARTGDAMEPDVVVVAVGPEEVHAEPPLRALAGTAAVNELPLGQVALNARLATRLGAAVGDEVVVVVGVPEHDTDDPDRTRETRTVDAHAVTLTVTVAGVVADEGLADLRRRPAVLVRRSALQEVTGLVGEVTELHVVRADPDPRAADDIVRSLEPSLRRLGLVAATVGLDAMDIADDEAGQFRSILMILAAVVIGAASVAAVQLLTALTQDRSREIAQLRVHGVAARTLRRLVAGEAALYAVVGGLLGAVAAVPLAGWMARLLADHFAQLSAGRGREQVALDAAVDPATVVTGVAIVVVAAILAGRSAGRRVTTTDPGTLLRGPLTALPPPVLSARRTVVVALLGSLLLGMGLGGGVATDALRYLGLTLLLGAWWMLARRRAQVTRRRVLDRRAAWAGLAWATVGAAALADFSQGYETGFGVLFVAGVVSVVAVTVLVAGRFRSVMRAVRAYVPLGPWQAALRCAGAQAEAAAGRTARLHATFGIVLFAAAALQVLGNAQAVDVGRQGGGFDVIATSVVGVDPAAVAATPGVARALSLQAGFVPEDRYGVVDSDDNVYRVRYPVRLVGATSAVPDAQDFRLAETLPDHPTAAAALAAVVRDGDKVVIDRYARPPGATVGDDVVLDLGLGRRTYRLIAVLDTFLLGSVFVSEAELPQLVPPAGATLVLASAEPGVGAAALADRLAATGADVGLAARTVAQVAEDVVNVNRTFTDVFALMLLIGLVVALLAVAATIVRAAREQRLALSLLWAHGLRRRHVVAVLAAEPAVVAATGGVVGMAVGLAVVRALFATGFADLPFVLDAGRLLGTLGLLGAGLVVTCLLTAVLVAPGEPGQGLREAR